MTESGPVAVSVIVPHFEDERRLALVLAGLRLQTLPPHCFEVIIADDGSAVTPHIAAQPFRTRVVRQEDRGFRAAAARNLGAGVARGSVLSFLDGDTIPSPGYLAALTAPCQDELTLTVGARRHVDLEGWQEKDLRAFLTGAGPEPRNLADPQWLADGYTDTHDLRDADDTSFRYVISAVLAMPTKLFRTVGGFDGSFTGYGGEDWDLAQRCWLAGANLRHVPEAVAWHDGPDAGVRNDVAVVKNRETIRLAEVLTHPLIRGEGMVYAIPDIAVTADITGWTLGQVAVFLQSWLNAGDVGLWLTATPPSEAPVAADPRVHLGEVPAHVLERCRYQIRVTTAVRLANGSLRRLLQESPAQPTGPATAASFMPSRTLGFASLRGLPPPEWIPLQEKHLQTIPADVIIERWRQAQFG